MGRTELEQYEAFVAGNTPQQVKASIDRFLSDVTAGDGGRQDDPLKVLKIVRGGLEEINRPEIKSFVYGIIPEINRYLPLLPPISGGSDVTAGDLFTRKVSAFLELGPLGRVAVGTAAVATGFLAWGINAVTSAQGMAGNDNPDALLYGIGFTLNVIEISGLHAFSSDWGLKEAIKLSRALGFDARPDKIQRAYVLAIGAITAGAYLFDAVTTATGLKEYFGEGPSYDITRYFYAALQTIITEISLGAGETMIRSGIEESRTG